ncbi:thymidylate synthase [Vibrio parahaemolyticus]|nr:thymidylate synthase [Vibrio parahaemolyticus]
MLRLADSGAVSNPALVAFEPSVFLLLTGMIFIKNVLLTTSEPRRCRGKKGRFMGKVVKTSKVLLASVAETLGGLGISNWASVGPLV